LVLWLAALPAGAQSGATLSVVNAASFAPGPLSAGSDATLFGNLPVSSPVAAPGPPFPTALAGVSIQLGSAPAPLFYASATQVNFQIPWEVAGAAQGTLTVAVNGQNIGSQTIDLSPVSPAIFSLNDQGSGQGAILDTAQNLVDAGHPAMPGATAIEIFATGLGAVSNQPPSGAASPSSPLATTPANPTVTIGGVSAQVLFSGLAPGLTGVYQVNALVPGGAPGGSAVPVVIALGGSTSNTVTIAVAGSAGWQTFAHDSQHTAVSSTAAQPLNRIHWQTPVDLNPQYTDNELLIHYGSPLVTPANTVIVPVKTGAAGGFRVEAHAASDGALRWMMNSDYVPPPHDWIPEFSPALTPNGRVYFPGPGGTLYYRENADSATGNQGQIAFYGTAAYQANTQAYNANVMISTPIVSDGDGNLYFGFLVTGSSPASLQSGIARISATGQGTWISASAAAGGANISQVVQNCAPALNPNTGTLYVAVSDGTHGYLVALNSATLAPVARVALTDPASGGLAVLSDNGSTSPFVGPDGDIYFGVLESTMNANHDRGWLLHFNASLSQTKLPGSFGWDDTPSLVPTSMVPSYAGASPYLLMTKYNDYAEAGGTGQNRLAVLDPDAAQTYSVTGTQVMREVLTVLAPTPNPEAPGVKEWCINSAAVDPATHSILANNEDGKLYRWNLANNTLSQTVVLTPGLGEAYTPTVIGPDGTVYAINNATLFAVGQ